MKYFLLIFGLLFCAAVATAQTAVISPLNPISIPGGSTTAFTCTSNCGTTPVWSCANTSNGGTCLGSINSGSGVYTPPATLAAGQSLGGYQLLPNDHVYNTNISALPVDTGGKTFNVITGGAIRSSNVVTLTLTCTGAPQCFLAAVGQPVTIAGMTDSSFNGTFNMLAYDGNNAHIKYSNSGADTTTDSGTVFVPWTSGMGTTDINFIASIPFNYTNGSTPTDTWTFWYTPSANGVYETPVWPTVNIQSGWFGALANEAGDHHFFTFNTTNGNIQERYQYIATAVLTGCTENAGGTAAVCTMTPGNTSPGFSNPGNAGGKFAIGSFTGADTWLNGTWTMSSASLTTITATIAHTANTTTSTTGNATLVNSTSGIGVRPCITAGNCNSGSGLKYTYADYALPAITTNAANTVITPLILKAQEVNQACATGAAINHALSITISNAYIAKAYIWPTGSNTGSGTTSGINPYGQRFRLKSSFAIGGFSACAQVILTTLKNYGVFLTDGGLGWQVNVENANFSTAAATALKSITSAGITIDKWEVVNETSLITAGGTQSGATTTGEVVTYSATGVSPASTNVDLQGTAVNLPTLQQYFMAGTPATQLVGYSVAGGITWTMSPTVGTLTSGGLYTPPASVTVGTMSTTTVTATSAVNGAVTATMTIYVLPASNFNLTQGTINYTDTHSVVWFAGYGIGSSNAPSWQGCCQNDASMATTPNDKQLFWNRYYSSQTSNDFKMDFYVPAGTYTVTFNNGTTLASGADVRYFYGNGTLLGTIDSTLAAGGQHLQWTQTFNVTASSNVLSIYNAGIGNQANNAGDISSISIALSAGAPTIGFSPSPVSFANTNVGSSSGAVSVTVTNTGTANLILSSGAVSITGSNSGDFSFSSDTCSSHTITPSSTCTVSVTFTPTTTGARSANLTINDVTDSVSSSDALNGTGTTAGVVPNAPIMKGLLLSDNILSDTLTKFVQFFNET